MYRYIQLLFFAAVNVFINLQLQVAQSDKGEISGNYILLPCGFIYFSIFSFFFFWDLLVSMDSQVPRPALNNLAPSTPELLAFWVGNLLSAKFQEF